MVKIGDKIKIGNNKGEVTKISKIRDGRYIIYYTNGNRLYYLLEGDKTFEVINKR